MRRHRHLAALQRDQLAPLGRDRHAVANRNARVAAQLRGGHHVGVVVVEADRGRAGGGEAAAVGERGEPLERLADGHVVAAVLHREQAAGGLGFDAYVDHDGRLLRGSETRDRVVDAEMNPTGRRRKGQWTPARAKPRRRLAEVAAERPRERFRRVVAGIERDVDDWPVGPSQFARRPLEPQPPHVRAQRFADEPAEHAVEVEPGEVRHSGEPLGRERLVQVVLDEAEHPPDPIEVVVARRGLHGCRGLSCSV